MQSDPVGADGAASDAIQGFRFRLILTKNPGNRIPFTKPDGYDPAEFELQRRFVQAGGTLQVPRVALPHGKTEPGVWHHLQSNLPGHNHGWNTASYAERERMLRESLRWQQGLCWFLAHDPAVPEAIRQEWLQWGLARDEFIDHGGWPRMFYVRNGRRMVSDCVLTEAHGRKEKPELVADPVALAWWPPDLHSARRIVRDGAVWNEGAVFGRDDWIPFGISYRAIVPRAAECGNLLTPTCPSSSYVAYGALRLEWTFMAIGQAAAFAAVLAIDHGTRVQEIDYPELRSRLLAARQVLELPQNP